MNAKNEFPPSISIIHYLNGKNGEIHCESGPALEWDNGKQEWWVNGVRHRENGPAIECPDGYREWWINGGRLTEEEFGHFLEKKALKEKLEATLPHKTINKRGKI